MIKYLKSYYKPGISMLTDIFRPVNTWSLICHFFYQITHRLQGLAASNLNSIVCGCRTQMLFKKLVHHYNYPVDHNYILKCIFHSHLLHVGNQKPYKTIGHENHCFRGHKLHTNVRKNVNVGKSCGGYSPFRDNAF